MEKGELKTGQLLEIKEKNGKLIREYVAGFFGDQPIIKQRLLTPQEARIYREDLEKEKTAAKSTSQEEDTVVTTHKEEPELRPATKTRAVAPAPAAGAKPRRKLKRRPVAGKPAPSGEVAETAEEATAEVQVAESSAPVKEEPTYILDASTDNATFIQNLVAKETDKSNYVAANTQKALDAINRVGSPEMKIYRIGVTPDSAEGEVYSQREYIARNILGLPIWKPVQPSAKAS